MNAIHFRIDFDEIGNFRISARVSKTLWDFWVKIVRDLNRWLIGSDGYFDEIFLIWIRIVLKSEEFLSLKDWLFLMAQLKCGDKKRLSLQNTASEWEHYHQMMTYGKCEKWWHSGDIRLCNVNGYFMRAQSEHKRNVWPISITRCHFVSFDSRSKMRGKYMTFS